MIQAAAKTWRDVSS